MPTALFVYRCLDKLQKKISNKHFWRWPRFWRRWKPRCGSCRANSMMDTRSGPIQVSEWRVCDSLPQAYTGHLACSSGRCRHPHPSWRESESLSHGRSRRPASRDTSASMRVVLGLRDTETSMFSTRYEDSHPRLPPKNKTGYTCSVYPVVFFWWRRRESEPLSAILGLRDTETSMFSTRYEDSHPHRLHQTKKPPRG